MASSDHDLRTAATEGWATADRADPQPTVTYFKELLAQHPSEILALYHCARAHDWAGEPHLAVPLYERAFGGGLDGPELCRAMNSYGSALRNLGRHDDAVAVLEDAHRRFPEDLLIPCYLALALHGAGRSAHALALMIELARDHIDDPDIRANHWPLGNYAAALRID